MGRKVALLTSFADTFSVLEVVLGSSSCYCLTAAGPGPGSSPDFILLTAVIGPTEGHVTQARPIRVLPWDFAKRHQAGVTRAFLLTLGWGKGSRELWRVKPPVSLLLQLLLFPKCRRNDRPVCDPMMI